MGRGCSFVGVFVLEIGGLFVCVWFGVVVIFLWWTGFCSNCGFVRVKKVLWFWVLGGLKIRMWVWFFVLVVIGFLFFRVVFFLARWIVVGLLLIV